MKKSVTLIVTNFTCANFTDYIAQVSRDSLAKHISNARFYACLNDGSTDASVTEQELVYVLYLSEGTPTVKFLSIESVKSADAVGITASIEEAFHRLGVTSFTNKLIGLNVDGASVNTGIHRGVGALLKERAPWMQVIHCFNHRVELALKDAFKTTAFSNIDEMLLKLHYLYRNSPKRLRELRELATAYEGGIPKPTKVNGTRWIDHKYKVRTCYNFRKKICATVNEYKAGLVIYSQWNFACGRNFSLFCELKNSKLIKLIPPKRQRNISAAKFQTTDWKAVKTKRCMA